MDLIDLARHASIDWQRTVVELGSGFGLSYDFDISPSEFLRFAQDDAGEGGTRGAANALTNAKRAIDCQTDKVLACFGYSPGNELPPSAAEAIERHEKIHGKVESTVQLRLLRALNIAPTLLVSRIRQSRHALEHRYERPDTDTIMEAIELADLYIRAADHVLRLFQYEVTWGAGESMTTPDCKFRTCLYSHFDSGQFHFVAYSEGKKVPHEVLVTPGEAAHFPLLKLYTAFTLELAGHEALAELLAIAGCPIPPARVGLGIRY